MELFTKRSHICSRLDNKLTFPVIMTDVKAVITVTLEQVQKIVSVHRGDSVVISSFEETSNPSYR